MQTIANGFISGLVTSLLAVAFTLVYLPTRTFHLGLGGIYALTPFVAWACTQNGLPLPIAYCIAILAGVGVSVACEILNHRPLEQRGASSAVHLISALGLYIVIVQVVVMVWGTQPKVLRVGLDSVIQLKDVVVTGSQITTLVASLVILAAFYLWLRYSTRGLLFRALADNPVELLLRGHNVRRLRLLAFVLSGAFTAVASLCAAGDVGFNPHVGLNALVLAVVATIVGGRFTFLGPMIGGVVLGMVRAEVGLAISTRWQEAVTFLLLAGFLLLRPVGIIGREGRLEGES